MKAIPFSRIALGLMILMATPSLAAPRVELELITAPGFPITGAQKWVQSLRDVEGITVQIRSGRAGEKVGVENLGTESAPLYHVIGILEADSRLILPGGKFRLGDVAGISQWIEKLRAGGESAPTERTSVFGLTGKELLALNEKLSRPVDFKTADRRVAEVVRDLLRPLNIDTTIADAARNALAGREVVAEELEGITSGTALAVVLRPLGLVVSAERTASRDIRLILADSRSAKEYWPIGWPLQQPPADIAPSYFKFLNVEIDDTPLSEALSAIQGRVEMPFLLDHNSLARQRIDPSEVRVSVPEARTYYKRIVDQMLNQAKLSGELRVDEAGKPFLWITTLIP